MHPGHAIRFSSIILALCLACCGTLFAQPQAPSIARPVPAAPAAPRAVVRSTIVMVYADALTGPRFERAVAGLREMGCKTVLLHHWSWHDGSPLGDRLPALVASLKSAGIAVGAHLDATVWGNGPHDEKLRAAISRIEQLGIGSAIYADGAERAVFAQFASLESQDKYEWYRANIRTYVSALRDIPSRPSIVMSSQPAYALDLCTRLQAIDQKDFSSLVAQVENCEKYLAGIRGLTWDWETRARDFGWLGPPIALDKPIDAYPPEEYAAAWLAAWKADAFVHFQTTLEWLARPELESTRRLIGSLEVARTARRTWAAPSAIRAPAARLPLPPHDEPDPGQAQPAPIPTPAASAPASAPALAFPQPPMPTFGLSEQPPARPAGWKSAVNLWYYVDNTARGATDDKNPNGSPDRPRLTLPFELPPGAVVEVRGGPYEYSVGGVIPAGGVGTADKPIFILGKFDGKRTRLRRPLKLVGAYVIAEGFEVEAWSDSPECGVYFINGIHHAAIRDFDVHDGPKVTTSAVAVYGDEGRVVSDVVIARSTIHDNGDWKTQRDEDHHGIGVGAHVRGVWIIGNTMFHNSGDGLQINAGSAPLLPTARDIFVIDNTSYENKQAGLWSKAATNVWFVGNTVRDAKPSPSTPLGAGIGCQYGPVGVRFYGNRVESCSTGLAVLSRSGPGGDGPGTDLHIMGNVFTGIRARRDRDSVWEPGAAIHFHDGVNGHLVSGNRIADCDLGITIVGKQTLKIENNEFKDVRGEHIWFEEPLGGAGSTMKGNRFDAAPRVKSGKGLMTLPKE